MKKLGALIKAANDTGKMPINYMKPYAFKYLEAVYNELQKYGVSHELIL